MSSLNTVISYPIPPYQNVPIHAEYYQPSQYFISGITLGTYTLVTTTVNHNYVVGQQVRLIIPPSFGTIGLNEKQAKVMAIPNPNQVLLNISSIGLSAFNTSTATTQPQILAIGDVNNGQVNANGPFYQGTFILGSFIDISPL